MGKLVFLGTGTSTGVPMIGCECGVCRSGDPKDIRLRSSAWISENGASVLIDTSTDLRAQALKARITRVDAVLYTHHHADHIHGIDELRSFNFLQKNIIPCYGRDETLDRIKSVFSYIFDDNPAAGGGKPMLELRPISGPVKVNGLEFIPVPVMHGAMEVFGYRINGAAYVTDCSDIPEDSMRLLEGLDTLILGALGLKRHDTHFTLERALETIEILAPKKAYLTHLNHNLGHTKTAGRLPDTVEMAWDGLSIDI